MFLYKNSMYLDYIKCYTCCKLCATTNLERRAEGRS